MSEANENNSSNNELLLQILQTLNMFQLQTTASFNELRAEIKENKIIGHVFHSFHFLLIS